MRTDIPLLLACCGAASALLVSSQGCTIITTTTPTDDGGTPQQDGGTPDDAASEAETGIDASVDFLPSNFDPSAVTTDGIGDVDVSGTEPCTLDTDQGTLVCANQATPFAIVTTPVNQGNQTAMLFAFNSFKLDAGTTLTVQGTKPLIIYSLGAVEIDGTIDLAAHGGTEGAGGFHVSGPGEGHPGGLDNTNAEISGGSGASFCGLGGGGAPLVGDGGTTSTPGASYGTADLVPIWGGSAGGSHSASGYGGGAIQIVSKTSLNIASGGGINVDGDGGDDHFTIGGGGGSGGSILLESLTVTIGGTLSANGGGGGDTSTPGADGNFGSTPAAGGGTAGGAGSGGATTSGLNGSTVGGDYGGGGGGAGRIRINTSSGLASISGTVSPSLTTTCATQGVVKPKP